jgi:peptidoglycan/LPS O-acetylase OafA/YrhL
MGPAELSRSASRDVAFDILKGIGIAEVLIHHTFSLSARKFAERESPEWWVLILTNRVLHFAIPTFLLVSALLLARSLAKHEKMDMRRYFSRRVVRSFWPFLLWSAIYLFFRAYVLRVGADTAPYTLNLPFGSITGPTALLDPIELRHDLYWGKAYYHLYFLSVLLQLTIVLPLVVWAFKRLKPSLPSAVGSAAAIQIGVYLLQANVWRSPHPASMALWYTPAILIGTWLGMNWSEWPEIWSRARKTVMALAICTGVPYVLLSIGVLTQQPVPNMLYNAVFSAYGTSMAVLLLGLASGWSGESKVVRGFAVLGGVSLPMFLLHPMLLHFFGGPTISKVWDRIPGAPILIWALLLLITLGFTKLLILCRLDLVLFGRSYRKELAPPAPRVELAPTGAGTA